MKKLLPALAVLLALLICPAAGAAQQADSTAAELAADTVPGDSLPQRPPLSAAADSVLRALRQLQGYTVTEYHGETANYRAQEGVLRLEGDAEVAREGDRLLADTILYLEREERVEAFGQPRVIGQEQDLEGDVLYYDLATRRATALGARTQITSDATWFVRGDVTLEGAERLYGSHARFTSCDLTIPHYHFEADRVMVIRNRILVARPARLYFGNVPVMVLPFIVQNLEEGRRSGFLSPRVGVHDIIRANSSHTRQISDLGFYWAVNQYIGAQLSSTWRSGAYTALLGNVDFSWRRQFLNGNFGLERYWRDGGGKELSLNARSSWQPDERTNMSLSGRYASSADFVRSASYDPREVTQDLNSSFSLSRRFNWGTTALGAERRQSIATGDVSMTLPSFSISLPSMTFFAPSGGGEPRWYNNATFTPGGISGSRSTNDYYNIGANRRDQELTRLNLAPSFSIGNLTVSSSAALNRAEIRSGTALAPSPSLPDLDLAGFRREEATWSSSISYQQRLIGSTSISPNISFDQQLVRDTITSDKFLGAPVRLSFGTSLNTDLYGFYPGIGDFSTIRHRLSPRLSYSYAPEVTQTELQARVFGPAGGRAQNRISLGINQTWEAKLREAPRPQQPLPQDSLSGDTISQAQTPSVPTDPTKVVLLSLTTSALEYDFVQAREAGNGFVTQNVSNSITSDYLRGLNIQVQHELFDRRDIDPAEPADLGQLGRFGPRMTLMSTSFQLGPESTVVQWLQRLGGSSRSGNIEDDGGVLPGPPESDEPAPAGQGSFTGNSQGTGAGPWSASFGYQYARPTRVFGVDPENDEAVQTLDGNMSFQLTPNLAVNWGTSYSITDRKFGSHRINFQRDLHEWQANFNFYQTPNGNTAFEFFVELTHNRDIRFDYSERDLGIDQDR